MSGKRKSPKPVRTTPPAPQSQPAVSGAMFLGNVEREVYLAISVVAAAVFIAYLPTTFFAGFLDLDDGQYVVENPLVKDPSLQNVWTFFREVEKPSTVVGYYQPLTMVSLMVDSWFSGAAPDSLIFHFTNVVLHALNAVLVFLIVRAASGGVVVPVLAALIFGLHPVQVESVTWVSQRKTVLSTAGALAAVLAHLYHTRTGKASWRWAGVGFYLLALLAKPTALFLPIFLVLLDLWPLRRGVARGIVEKWPYWIIMAVMGWISFLSQSHTAGAGVPNPQQLPALLRLSAYNLAIYARNLVWPTDLCLIYPTPSDLSLGNWRILAATLGAMGGLAALVTALRWSRAIFVGVGGALVLLGLALGPIRFYQSCVGDRFLYLPLAAIVLALAAGATWLWRRPSTGTRAMLSSRQGLVVLIAAALIVPLTQATLAQQVVWSDSEQLWLDVLARIPDDPLANDGLAGARRQQHDTLMAEAESLRVQGNTLDADAAVRAAQARLAEALTFIDRAIAAAPGDGVYFQKRGQILLLARRYDEAIADMKHGLALGMGGMTANGYVSLGVALATAQRPDEAAAAFDAALQTNPDIGKLHGLEMGQALKRAGRPDLALRYIAMAVRAAPADPDALWLLAATTAAANDWPRAAEFYRRARELHLLRGLSPAALDLGLANVYLELRQPDDAAALFHDPRVQSEFPADAQLGLAGVAALRGQADAAFEHLRTAISRKPKLTATLATESYLKSLHADPRWTELVPAATQSAPASSNAPTASHMHPQS